LHRGKGERRGLCHGRRSRWLYKFGTASLMILLAAARLVSLSGSQRQIVPRVRRAACACGGAAPRWTGRLSLFPHTEPEFLSCADSRAHEFPREFLASPPPTWVLSMITGQDLVGVILKICICIPRIRPPNKTRLQNAEAFGYGGRERQALA